MSYLGAGFYGYQRCPVCGHGMLNGICYNTAGHHQRSNYANKTVNSASSGSVNHYASEIPPDNTKTRTPKIVRIEVTTPSINITSRIQFYMKRGRELIDCRRYKEAAEMYDNSIELDPNNFDAWNYKGYCLAEIGRYREAIEAFDRAVNVNDNQTRTLKESLVAYNRNCCLKKLGRYEYSSVDQGLTMRDIVERGINEAEYNFSTRDW